MQNKLIQLISEKFNISVDKAVEFYPLLRNQFVIHQYIADILEVIGLIVIFSGITLLLEITFICANAEDIKTILIIHKKPLKYSSIIFITSGLLFIVLRIVQCVYAPDIIFIKGMIN